MCSAWRPGRCAVRFSNFAPWGDYRVIYTDYTDMAIVYSCSKLIMGMFSMDYLWVLTREILPIGSPEHAEMVAKVDRILVDKVPNYDAS